MLGPESLLERGPVHEALGAWRRGIRTSSLSLDFPVHGKSPHHVGHLTMVVFDQKAAVTLTVKDATLASSAKLRSQWKAEFLEGTCDLCPQVLLPQPYFIIWQKGLSM
jgi:hypothetical protein